MAPRVFVATVCYSGCRGRERRGGRGHVLARLGAGGPNEPPIRRLRALYARVPSTGPLGDTTNVGGGGGPERDRGHRELRPSLRNFGGSKLSRICMVCNSESMRHAASVG